MQRADHCIKRVTLIRVFCLILIFAISLFFYSCRLEGGTVSTNSNPVVMRTNNAEITLFDFSQSYYGSASLQYYYYGLISASDYCNMVIEEAKAFLLVYNAAIDAGIAMTEPEKAEFEADFNSQLEDILQQYEANVDSSIVGEEERHQAAIELLSQSLAQEGYTYDEYIGYAKNNMYMYTISQMYYDSLSDSITVDDGEINDYITDQLDAASELDMTTYYDINDAYITGSGPSPVYVPDECFSVNHIFLQFDYTQIEDGSIEYDTASTADDEAKVEQLLTVADGFEGFMELEAIYGDDPGMDQEAFYENGYLIHEDYESNYYDGFVFAALNLYYGEWSSEGDSDSDYPELSLIDMADGTKVVKVATERGIHYIIINKIYEKGAVEYEQGDIRWESWRSYLKDDEFTKLYQTLYEEWQTDYTVDILYNNFWSRFVPDEPMTTPVG